MEPNFGAGGGAAYQGGGMTGDLIYTPGVNADSYYVYYLGFPEGGILTLTATGGTSVIVNTSMPDGIYRSLVRAGGASASNTVTSINMTFNSFVVGVEPFLSTVSQVLVGNAGVDSATTQSWLVNNATYGGVPFIKTVAPDLTIISLGVNDACQSRSVGETMANLQLLITAARSSGDVILVDWPPSGSVPCSTYEALYYPEMRMLAALNHIPFYDLYGELGEKFQAALMSDPVHLNDQGYLEWAQGLYALLNPAGESKSATSDFNSGEK